MSEPVPDFVHDELQRLKIHISAARLAQQAKFLDLLLETNRSFNLTAVRDRATAWRRHVLDSLALLRFLEFIPQGGSIVDVGSGGGLPGVPLAIARPDLRVTLLEATGKKARFLDRCVKELGLVHCRAIHERAETVGHDPAHRQCLDAAVCRAIGPMRELLEYTLPLVRIGGKVLAIKGSKAEEELNVAQCAMEQLGAGHAKVHLVYAGEDERSSVIVVIDKARPTPAEYPRRPGAPRRLPL